ncbi:META domain-containing protein [Rhodobacteraceae bacterium F11138]|nr:META domain-containing protein [Rhodobacteraceae bacterium F11138]
MAGSTLSLKAGFAALCAICALTSPSIAQADADRTVTVSGQISYRQKIALVPDSTVTVSLRDISRADAPSRIMARASFPGQQVPIPFSLTVVNDLFDPRHSYALSASITGVDGRLHWITDTVHAVDVKQASTDFGTLFLTQVSGTDTVGGNLLTGGEWRVQDIDGHGVIDIAQTTISFERDGRVSGSGGCNRYTGSYEQADDTLTFGPVAVTRKACVPAVARQEDAFLSFMDTQVTVQFTETGALVLTDPQGRSLTARR